MRGGRTAAAPVGHTCRSASLSWLWKKLSLAFFHESERRKSRGFSPLAAAASSGE
jgi:hypothetical protein